MAGNEYDFLTRKELCDKLKATEELLVNIMVKPEPTEANDKQAVTTVSSNNCNKQARN